MAIIDLFSKRQKRARGEMPDVYSYDGIPQTLRVQLLHIFEEGISDDGLYHDQATTIYKTIHNTICREYGVFHIGYSHHSDRKQLSDYLLATPNVEHVLDITELCLRCIDKAVRQRYNIGSLPDDLIAEANTRFREHGVGYEFASGEMIRVDSQVIHSEVVKPALALLADKQFHGANDEFLKAHEHYRHGNYKECLVECLKAFESTLKTICTIKGWQHTQKDTATKLIDICEKNGLFASFMQTHIGSLRSILQSGIPTLRNQLGGHGQGTAITTVSESTARFALHTTATNILFFIESSQGK